jgi:flagella basal body P-ring formation protein FlgA
MRFPLVILIVLAASLTATLPVIGADITHHEEASAVPGVLVRLGDVATIHGAEAERLADAPLMPSPAPGTSQHLSAGALRDLLKAQGVDPRDHFFRGAYRTQITTPLGRSASPSQTETAEWQVNPASAGDSTMAFRVRGGYAAPAPDLPVGVVRKASLRESKSVEEAVKAAIQTTLDARRQPGELRLAVRDVELTSRAVNELCDSIGQPLTAALATTATPLPGSLTCKVWPADGLAAEPYLVVADLVEQPMRVVATTPLSRGALVTASAVRLEPTPLEEIGRANAAGFSTLEEVVGKETSRPIRMGETFSDINTAPPMMVRKNDLVDVVSGGGGISVTMHMITVQTLDRDEQFPARVVAPRRLAVLSGGSALTGGLQ